MALFRKYLPHMLTLCLLASWNTVFAFSHPISVTEAHVFVARSSARVRVKLYAEDLFLFHDLQPTDIDFLPPEELRRGLEAHRRFLLDKITLRDAKGEAFAGRVTDVQPFEIPEEGISVEELMLHTATYELEYPFAEPPEFLTIQQDISDENFIFPSEMKLTLHQSGTDLTFTDVLKPGAAETLRFDWSGEVLSDDATEEEWKAWFEKQREATLGITSYSSVYSFIYVEPAEVRHEILIPLASLKTILPLEHADPSFVEVAEQDGVRALIREWLADENPAWVNGNRIAPDFTRIDFYGLDLKDFAQQAKERRISLANGRVGIIITYPVADYPVREVRLTWNRFHSSLRKIQSVVFTYQDELQRFEFSRFNEPEDNEFVWSTESPAAVAGTSVAADLPVHPSLTLPVASLVLVLIAMGTAVAGGTHRWRLTSAILVLAALMLPFTGYSIDHPFRDPPPISADTANDVFQQLHSGAYRALDFGTEDRIYAELEHNVDGDLLESLYLQLRESLRVREQGGAIARVRSVDYGDGQQTAVEDPNAKWPAFRYRSQWTVRGTVEHWGHIHERQNRFSAVFCVEPKAGKWKITEMQIEDQQSVATNTRLRKF